MKSFEFCLDSLHLPASLNTIEAEAFANLDCQAVFIPEGCTSIGERAFAHCRALSSLHVPSMLKRLERRAFENCTSLSAISLPAGLYRYRVLAPLGFPDPLFRSGDYFPMLPWYLLFLCGWLLGRILERDKRLQRIARIKIPPLSVYAVLKEVRELRRFQVLVYPENTLELRLEEKAGCGRSAAFESAKAALLKYLASQGVSRVSVTLSETPPQQDANSGKFKHIVNMGKKSSA